MEFKTTGKLIKREPATQTVIEIKENNKYLQQARNEKRDHVFIHELPYSQRFVNNRSKHDFVAVNMGVIHL